MPNPYRGEKIIIDYSSPNTAKQMHIGHLRSMNIGNSIYKILKFCGADVAGDNHIGDWGTQFGILILAIKQNNIDCGQLTLEEIEQLYKQGNSLVTNDPHSLDVARNELVKLQNGDPENLKIWQIINEVSQKSFDEIYQKMGISFEYTLGESFYRDKVNRVYKELTDAGIAREDDGALCVFFDDDEKFSGQPFIIRKADGASNYAATDLATVLYRTEVLHADKIIYVTDGRQQDHFQQLFLTVKRWYKAYGRTCPDMDHVWFGMILGEDGKAIKTRSGESLKLHDLISESEVRAAKIIESKDGNFSPSEQLNVASVLGINSIKYADLQSNRTNDYVFSWPKMLSFDGNTAAYLLYANVRIKSILKKIPHPSDTFKVDIIETPEERSLIRKLIYFPEVLAQTAVDLRPHYICTYLFELTTEYSSFYNTNRIIGESSNVSQRRLSIISKVQEILEIGLHLLGLQPLDKM